VSVYKIYYYLINVNTDPEMYCTTQDVKTLITHSNQINNSVYNKNIQILIYSKTFK